MTTLNFLPSPAATQQLYIRFSSVHLRAWLQTPASRHVGKKSRVAFTAKALITRPLHPSEASGCFPDSPRPKKAVKGGKLVRSLRYCCVADALQAGIHEDCPAVSALVEF
jgi:hypothetical protein